MNTLEEQRSCPFFLRIRADLLFPQEFFDFRISGFQDVCHHEQPPFLSQGGNRERSALHTSYWIWDGCIYTYIDIYVYVKILAKCELAMKTKNVPYRDFKCKINPQILNFSLFFVVFAFIPCVFALYLYLYLVLGFGSTSRRTKPPNHQTKPHVE